MWNWVSKPIAYPVSAGVLSSAYAWGIDKFSAEQSEHIAFVTSADASIASFAGFVACGLVGTVVGVVWGASRGEPSSERSKMGTEMGTLFGITGAMVGGVLGGIQAYKSAAAEYIRPAQIQKQSKTNLPTLPVTIQLLGHRVIAYIM
jgi:hypothetical protein